MRLALPLAIVTPCLFAAACGDNLQPDEGDSSSVQSGNTDQPDGGVDVPDGDAPDASEREIIVDLLVTSPECFDAIAEYEVTARYADDNSPVGDLQCSVQADFAGPTSNSCTGRLNVFDGGEHLFNIDVQDANGAVAHADLRRFVEAPLRPNFDFELHSCGLHIDYNLSAPMAQTRVVTYTSADGTVSGPFPDGGGIDFPAAGAYTLTAYVEQERPVGPICSLTIPRPITIVECDHEHGPSCADW